MGRIRPIKSTDVESVVGIESQCFPTPWDRSIFEAISQWRGNIPLKHKRIIRMRVLEFKEQVEGYIVWEEDKITENGHVMNLAVSNAHRGKGWGEKLLRYAIELMRDHEMKLCFLEVRENNTTAQALYKKIGMVKSDVRVGYYESEDAYIYTLDL